MALRPALVALTSGLAVIASGLTVPLTATTATAAERTVTVVGSLQDELGCSGDWQPDCAKTDAHPRSATPRIPRVFGVPAGQLRVQGRDQRLVGRELRPEGAKTARNLPLVLERPGHARFTYDDTTHRVGIAPSRPAGAATKADRSWPRRLAARAR